MVEGPADQGHPVQLPLRGGDQGRVAVAEVQRGVRREHVQVAAAIGVGDPGALGLGDHYGQRVIVVCAVRLGQGTQVCPVPTVMVCPPFMAAVPGCSTWGRPRLCGTPTCPPAPARSRVPRAGPPAPVAWAGRTTWCPSLTAFSPSTAASSSFASTSSVKHAASAARPGVVERGRVVGGGVGVEHAQRRVQVVEPGVHQAEADHRQPEQLLEVVPDIRVAAEPVPGQDHPAREHDVPLALVDESRLVHRREAAVAEPVQIGRSFCGPFRVPEPGAEDGAADHRGTVGREDHVRQAGPGVDVLHRVAEPAVGVAQQLPLEHGPGGVHGFPAAIQGLMEYCTVKWSGGHIR